MRILFFTVSPSIVTYPLPYDVLMLITKSDFSRLWVIVCVLIPVPYKVVLSALEESVSLID